MYRLLIVDDEKHIRNRIRAAVNWELLGIQIIGEAENGLEGLTIAMREKPDIVLCDVRMPGMDGISFATELMYRYPSVQFIFISGYSDKMYLKNALRLEAVDYIFKPYELSDLLSAIEKAITRIEKNARDKTLTIDNDLALKLVYHAQNQEDLKHFLDSASVAVDFWRPWTALLIRFSTGISFSSYQSQSMTESLQPQVLISQYYYSFEQEVTSLFQNQYLMSRGGDSYLVFANLPESEYHNISLKLSGLFSLVPAIPAVIGISEIFREPIHIKEAFCQARQASFSGFLSGYQKIYPAHDVSLRRFSADNVAKEDFLSALEKQDIAAASGFLKDYISYLSGCSPDDIPAIKDSLLHLALHLHGKLKNSPFRLINEFINTAATLNDILQYLQCLLDSYQTELNSLDSKGRIIYETEQYILNHLGEEISVHQIADSVYLSPTYLCYLYKKKTGKTLKQFIVDSRMEKARSLLLDTNMKIGDIAASLGYSNQNYFARLFASHYGVTPSSFRNHE
ncbi:MAG TPA: response regulator [Candidatus Eisenbergiella merdipullorum]|uniref:Stage 0 sporulation protein A homolog n=1 Tax=Candidatus Eisenbergiella merdipullorum TaxID=2838553 RepID=A0A9D2I5U7_9FIRM|nr:response regulator [Candidatus Eisenbergiella merdipullorum]